MTTFQLRSLLAPGLNLLIAKPDIRKPITIPTNDTVPATELIEPAFLIDRDQTHRNIFIVVPVITLPPAAETLNCTSRYFVRNVMYGVTPKIAHIALRQLHIIILFDSILFSVTGKSLKDGLNSSSAGTSFGTSGSLDFFVNDERKFISSFSGSSPSSWLTLDCRKYALIIIFEEISIHRETYIIKFYGSLARKKNSKIEKKKIVCHCMERFFFSVDKLFYRAAFIVYGDTSFEAHRTFLLFFDTGGDSSRGNIAMRKVNTAKRLPRMSHPSHQAPNHRGSSLSMTG